MCVCSQDSYPRYLKSDLYKNMLAKAIVPQETKKRWHFYTHPTFFSPLSIFKHAFNERIFLFSFPSVCSPSWDARGTLAPPLLRLPPRQQRKKALPRGQVPTLQLARISDPGQKKKNPKKRERLGRFTLCCLSFFFKVKQSFSYAAATSLELWETGVMAHLSSMPLKDNQWTTEKSFFYTLYCCILIPSQCAE